MATKFKNGITVDGGSLTVAALTASQFVKTDASKNLTSATIISSDLATYSSSSGYVLTAGATSSTAPSWTNLNTLTAKNVSNSLGLTSDGGLTFNSSNTSFDGGTSGVTIGIDTAKVPTISTNASNYTLAFSATNLAANTTLTVPASAGNSGDIVTTAGTQTLTNKTLTSAKLTSTAGSGPNPVTITSTQTTSGQTITFPEAASGATVAYTASPTFTGTITTGLTTGGFVKSAASTGILSNGTIASSDLPSVNIGTTSVALNRSSGALTLAGITLDGPTFTNTITIPLTTASTAGVVHASSAGALSTSLITNADVDTLAGIVDTKLATIATANKVSNSATTATNTNTNSAIVARDGSGNFSAGTITANLTGNATGIDSGSTQSGVVAGTTNKAVDLYSNPLSIHTVGTSGLSGPSIETMNRMIASSTLSLTTGTIYLVRIVATATMNLTYLSFACSNVGTTTSVRGAIFDSSRTFLKGTSEITPSVASNTLSTGAFTTSQAVTAGTVYYLALGSVSSVALQVKGVALTSAMTNVNPIMMYGATGYTSSSFGGTPATGYTSLPWLYVW
jgi:hypothetical protein